MCRKSICVKCYPALSPELWQADEVLYKASVLVLKFSKVCNGSLITCDHESLMIIPLVSFSYGIPDTTKRVYLHYFKNHPRSQVSEIYATVAKGHCCPGYNTYINTMEDRKYRWASTQYWNPYRGIVRTPRSHVHSSMEYLKRHI